MAQPNWNTATGSIGTFPAAIAIIPIELSASPVSPATSVTYKLLSGKLPNGLTFSETGIISGIPNLVPENTVTTFVIRVTDNLQNIRDRTFSMTITGTETPKFTTTAGTLFTQPDSIWVEYPIQYSNPIAGNTVNIRLLQGTLPPGLEINEAGLIRGYPKPPITNVNLPLINTTVVSISSNVLTSFTVQGFSVGRPITFSGAIIGGLNAETTYYIREVFLTSNSFTISALPNGPILPLDNSVGFMPATLPVITRGQPTVQSYTFTLQLSSLLGSDTETYSIVVANQNAPASIGGGNNPPNTRVPAIYNTRPPTFNINNDDLNYDYYVLPANTSGNTYPITTPAYIGKFTSDNQFTFKILGHDFDGNQLKYTFADLPLGLYGDPVTGWVTGNPIISDNSISDFTFSVSTYKSSNPSIATPFYNFSFIITNDIVGDVVWKTDSTLKSITNGTVSVERVEAISDVSLNYRLVSGMLPPNLSLLDNGEISGAVAYQPSTAFLPTGSKPKYTFTIEAYSELFPVVNSQKTFEWVVDIVNNQPTDTLYIKCAPSEKDRDLLASLLNNQIIFPTEYLYRPTDNNFGKSSSVVYEHAYGIYANDLNSYVAAITKNHYWRQITLGEIKTAIARNDDGEIIYEVVYSEVIDNLVNLSGESVSKEIYWPRPISLSLGPWYTSVENLFTSYELPAYYTSLTPGEARNLYPNSLINMRQQVSDVLGQVLNTDIYPKWMTSQQRNGSSTGFIPAWVICYTKPGFSEIIKNNIETYWVDELKRPYTLNMINFKIDRFTVDKSMTYNYDTVLSPPAWTGLPSASPVPNPKDSKDFYVLFPRQTILPDNTQY